MTAGCCQQSASSSYRPGAIAMRMEPAAADPLVSGLAAAAASSSSCSGPATYQKVLAVQSHVSCCATPLTRPVPVGHDWAAPQVREVWLSSEDTGAYGRDIGSSIAELLQRCVAVLPADGRTMLRLGMTNPPFILEHLEAVAEVSGHAALCYVMLCYVGSVALCRLCCTMRLA